MRISAARGFVPDPCNSSGYLFGETEDYSVTVEPTPVFVTWDGEDDTEWDNPLNWDGDVLPTASDAVIIPTGAPQYPDFSGVLYVGVGFGPNACQSLIIQNGASLTIDVWGQISVFDDVNVQTGGTLNCNLLQINAGGGLYITGGTVIVNQECTFWNTGNMTSGTLYVGGILEFITGSTWTASGGSIICQSGTDTEIINAASNLFLSELIIESGATARLSENSEQVIFLQDDIIVEPNAEFTMETPAGPGNTVEIVVVQNAVVDGDNTGKGSYVNEGGTITVYGSTNVNSYYTDNRWHFISSPVSSAVSGVFLDLYLKAFDEATNSFTPSPGIFSTTYPLGVGEGFEIWSDIGNPIVTYTGGQFNNGNVSPNFTATDSNGDLGIGDGEGWNLVGNPYPSAIDVGTENDPVPGYTWTNIDQTLYAWNGTNYSSFNLAGDGTGVNGGTRYIPSIQGFFLKANDFSPVFTIPNSARLHSTQANYKSSDLKEMEIKMIVSGNNYSDEMIIRAIPAASELFDSKFDAYELPGIPEVPQLFTKAGTADLSINSLPEFTIETVIPLYLKVGEAGVYSVEADDFDLSKANLDVFLKDVFQETIIKLDEGVQYEFSSEPFDDEYRFELIFKDAENNQITTSSVYIFSAENTVYVHKETGVNTDIFVYDMMGREVARSLNNNNDKATIQVNGNTGHYVVKVIAGNYMETKKVFIK
jgi:hypothetical protein